MSVVYVTAFDDRLLHVYERHSGNLMHEVELPDCPLQLTVSIDRDRIAVACVYGGVVIFNNAMDELCTLQHDASTVLYTLDSELIVGTDKGHVIFDAQGVSKDGVTTTKQHAGTVWAIAPSPSFMYAASVSRDKTAIVWDLVSRSVRHVLKGHTESADCAVFISDDQLVTGGLDRTLRMWDLTSGVCTRTISSAHTDRILTLAVSRERDVLMSAGNDEHIRVWSMDGEALRDVDFGGKVKTMCVDASGELTVAGQDHAIISYSTETWEQVCEYPHHDCAVYGLVVSMPEGMCA